MTVPDSTANLARFTKGGGNHGGTGYPQARLLVLVACGTRAHRRGIRPTTSGETTYAPGLLRSLRRDDRAAGPQLRRRGADHRDRRHRRHVLVRGKNGRKLPVLRRYSDGSYLSVLGTTQVRVIDCQITIATSGRASAPGSTGWPPPCSNRPPPSRRADQAVSRTLGDRDRLPGNQVHHPRRPGPARPHPRRDQPRNLRPAGHLPGPAHRHGRRHQHQPRHRPRPGQLHHRPARRPRPAHLSRQRHRRHRHRPRRRHRPPRPGQPAARPPATSQPPRRQTRDLQIPGPRPRHRPGQLQSHHQHRHPDTATGLDSQHQPLTTRPWA